jgi:NADPH-dependent 2,4-dienoyl-CoA reductase/sulfur reductase-like enzyme
MDRIVVVGASLAGRFAVEHLRRKKYEGRIVLIGDEPHLPYDRPPLSKEVLRGEMPPEKTALRPKGYEDLGVELELGKAATALDVAKREVVVEGGARVGFDGLLLACGTLPRKLPMQPDLPGIYMLRTLDDALAMKAALAEKPRVVVIGAGFIGAEVAASCVKLGLSVTVLEALPVPLARGLGPTIGQVLAAMHVENGVDLRLSVQIERIEGEGKVERVVLADGSVIPCDLLCVGIGVRPATDWLEGSGLALDNGVLCDATCATNVPGIVAAGDVASWHNPLFDERMRVEHWTNAVEMARAAAETLLAAPGTAQPFSSAPLFWSDQYGVKIQGAGRPRADDVLEVVHGTTASRQFTALYGREGRLVGVVTFQQPQKLFAYRKMITERASFADALEAAQKG